MKTYTVVLTADQAAELNLHLRKLVRTEGANLDQSMFHLSAALGAARYGTVSHGQQSVIHVDGDDTRVDITELCPTTKTGGV